MNNIDASPPTSHHPLANHELPRLIYSDFDNDPIAGGRDKSLVLACTLLNHQFLHRLIDGSAVQRGRLSSNLILHSFPQVSPGHPVLKVAQFTGPIS